MYLAGKNNLSIYLAQSLSSQMDYEVIEADVSRKTLSAVPLKLFSCCKSKLTSDSILSHIVMLVDGNVSNANWCNRYTLTHTQFIGSVNCKPLNLRGIDQLSMGQITNPLSFYAVISRSVAHWPLAAPGSCLAHSWARQCSACWRVCDVRAMLPVCLESSFMHTPMCLVA